MREAHLTIDCSALLHNLQQVKHAAPDSKVLAMVKANAYGHGTVLAAQTLAPHVDALGVAFLAEALALRTAGITTPIAVLEGVFSADELEQALAHFVADAAARVGNHQQRTVPCRVDAHR